MLSAAPAARSPASAYARPRTTRKPATRALRSHSHTSRAEAAAALRPKSDLAISARAGRAMPAEAAPSEAAPTETHVESVADTAESEFLRVAGVFSEAPTPPRLPRPATAAAMSAARRQRMDIAAERRLEARARAAAQAEEQAAEKRMRERAAEARRADSARREAESRRAAGEARALEERVRREATARREAEADALRWTQARRDAESEMRREADAAAKLEADAAARRRAEANATRDAARLFEGHRRDSSRARRQCRGQHDATRLPRFALIETHHGARVEAIPAEPEDERAEDLEDGRVTGHEEHRAAHRVEPPRARTDDERADERRDATRHVDNA